MANKIREMAKLWVDVNIKNKTELDFFLHFRELFEKECMLEWQDYQAAPEHYVTFDKVEKGEYSKEFLSSPNNI